MQRVRLFIPHFHGCDFPVQEFVSRFNLPKELRFITNISASHKLLPRLRWEGIGIPAEEGSDSVFTIAWTTTRLSKSPVSAEKFQSAYRAVSQPLELQACLNAGGGHPYAVLHLRGPDQNTFCPFEGAYDDRQLYCTAQVLRQLFSRRGKNVSIFAVSISNNASWASERQ